MPQINSKSPLVPNPYSLFSQLASSPYASLHPLALKRLFEEEYYFKSLLAQKTSLLGAAFTEKLKNDLSLSNDKDLFHLNFPSKVQVDMRRPSSLMSATSGALVSCSPSSLSPSPSSLFLPSHIDTNNNTIPTRKSSLYLLSHTIMKFTLFEFHVSSHSHFN